MRGFADEELRGRSCESGEEPDLLPGHPVSSAGRDIFIVRMPTATVSEVGGVAEPGGSAVG